MEKTLSGVRVVDVSHLVPGPCCSLLLRKLGAQVTKVELPQRPDPCRASPALFKEVQAGKRLLAFDYSREPGKTRLLKMIGGADVFLEGFRPGLLAKRGLGPEELLKRFPRLIYCSLTGYGAQGPRVASHDLNYQALAGLIRPPRITPFAAADLAGALEAAARISAALFARERTGRGAFLDVAMAESARGLNVLARTRPFERELGRWWEGGDPFYRLYRCKGGGWLAVAALEYAAAVELLRALGLEGRLADLSSRRRAALAKPLAQAFARRTRDGWASRLARADVCVTPVL